MNGVITVRNKDLEQIKVMPRCSTFFCQVKDPIKTAYPSHREIQN